MQNSKWKCSNLFKNDKNLSKMIKYDPQWSEWDFSVSHTWQNFKNRKIMMLMLQSWLAIFDTMGKVKNIISNHWKPMIVVNKIGTSFFYFWGFYDFFTQKTLQNCTNFPWRLGFWRQNSSHSYDSKIKRSITALVSN